MDFRENVLENLQDAFRSQLDPDLVASVLADSDYNVDSAFEILITLANENSGKESEPTSMKCFSPSNGTKFSTTELPCGPSKLRYDAKGKLPYEGGINDSNAFHLQENIKLCGGDDNWHVSESFNTVEYAENEIESNEHVAVFKSADILPTQHVEAQMTGVADVVTKQHTEHNNLGVTVAQNEMKQNLVCSFRDTQMRGTSGGQHFIRPYFDPCFPSISRPTLSNASVRIPYFENRRSSGKLEAFENSFKIIEEKINKQVLLLIVLRGLPGSGKSTIARKLKHNGVVFSTDDFFTTNGQYLFDSYKLPEAHEWNKKQVKLALQAKKTPVIIDNTNTEAWEMKPYVSMGLFHNYDIQVLEPNTSWKFCPRELAYRNTHGVPKKKIEFMLEKYQHNLTLNDLLVIYDIKLPECSASSEKHDVTIFNNALNNKNASEQLKKYAFPKAVTPVDEISNDDTEHIQLAAFVGNDLKDESEIDISQKINLKSAVSVSCEATTTNELKSFAKQNVENVQEISTGNKNVQNDCSMWDSEGDFEWLESNSPVLLFSEQPVINYTPKPPRENSAIIKATEHDNIAPKCSQNLLKNQEALDQSWNEDFSKMTLTSVKEPLDAMNTNLPQLDEIKQLEKSLKDLVGIEDCSFSSNHYDFSSDSCINQDTVSETPHDRMKDVSALEKCYPNVTRDVIMELLEKCNGEIDWVTNILESFNMELEVTSANLNSTSMAVGNDDLLTFRNTLQSPQNHVDKHQKVPCNLSDRPELTNFEKGASFEQKPSSHLNVFENKLVLQLDSGFAHQLEKLFGKVCSVKKGNEASGNDIGLQVCIDVDVAHQLHKSWVHTQRCLQTGNTGNYNSMSSMSSRPTANRKDAFPALTNVACSANQNLEKLHDKAVSYQKVNQWQFSEMDLATKLRKQQLQHYFPGVTIDSIDEIFFANNCNFSNAVSWLLTDKNTELTELEHQMLEAVKQDSMRHARVVEQADLFHDNEDESDSDNACEEQVDDGSWFYAETRKYYEVRQSYFNKAREAYEKGVPGAALYYSQQAHLYTRKIKLSSAEANRRVLVNNNMYRDTNTLDLHMLYVRDAIDILRVFLERKQELLAETQLKHLYLDIITGKGSHSTRKIPKIKMAVLDYLSHHNYTYCEKNPGLIQVKLT